MPSLPSQHRPAGVSPRAETVRGYDLQRGSAAARGYDRAWRTLRLAVLREEPLCRFCAAAGLVVAASEVDHMRTVAEAPDLRLVRENLRPLCKPCHSARTAREQGGSAGQSRVRSRDAL